MLKAALAGLVLSVSGLANAGLMFDFYWTGDTSEDSTIVSTADSTLMAMGTIEIDAAFGSTFDFSDILFTNISVTGDSIQDFIFTSWSSIGGTIAADGMSASFNASGNPYSYISNFYGCYYGGCGGDFSILVIDQDGGGSSRQVFYVNAEDALASMKMTRTEVPEPSTLAIFALGVIGVASLRFKKQS